MRSFIITTYILLIGNVVLAQYCGNSGSLVCNSTGTAQPGTFDPPYNAQPPLINGQLSTTVLQFTNFDTVYVSGGAYHVLSLKIDTLKNLPAGLCWATNKVNNTWTTLETGCIAISGTTCAPPGQYKLYLIFDITIGPGSGITLTTNGDVFPLNYYLRVNNSGDATVVVDTTQNSSNPFIPYGPAASCQVGPPIVTFGANQTVCGGSNIILSPGVSGGMPPYTYAWNTSGSSLGCQTCQNPSSVISQTSTYTLTVTDANQATASGSITYTVSGAGTPPQISFTNTNFGCNYIFDTTTLTITGGTAPYSVDWGDGFSNSFTSSPLSHIYTHSSSFLTVVQDAMGCTNSSFNTVNRVSVAVSLASSTPPTCQGQNTGQLTIAASGGTSPYSYHWYANSSTTNSLANIASGSYRVTVTDAQGCSTIGSYTLNPVNSPYFYVYMQSVDANCSNNGAVNSIPYGGAQPYSYLWNTSATTQNIQNLSGGNYSLTVTDSLGCNASGYSYVNTSCYSTISGSVFVDDNGNCTFDFGEAPVQNIYVEADGNGHQYFGIVNSDGTYSIQVNGTGTYNLRFDGYGWYGTGVCGNYSLCGNNTQTITIATNGAVSANNNFAFVASSGYDLDLHPGWTSANPGFEKEYWIMAYNQAYTPFNGQATVVFAYDSNLVYEYSLPPLPVHNPIAHTLTWVLDSVAAPFYDWYNGRLENFFMVPVSLPLAQMLHSDFSITPISGDCDSSNNRLSSVEVVTGSHDPNEKTVEPADGILESDSILTYTIHFQNTGTDSTHFIIVKDTLSASLDPASVRNVASSHPYTKFNISGKGILTWTFNPLRLVDSITNPSGSKGFITFQVKKKGNLPVGTSISNVASIYFDYNDAVVTNTVVDTVARLSATGDIGTGAISVRVFPNPFTNATNFVVTGLNEKYDFQLFDIGGRLEKKISSIQSPQFQLNRDDLTAGIYLYKLSTSSGKAAFGKIVVQ